jgi:hypothetical protein
MIFIHQYVAYYDLYIQLKKLKFVSIPRNDMNFLNNHFKNS